MRKSRKKGYNVAVVGVTGAVGQEMVRCLADRRFPVNELRPMASSRSAGKKIDWKGRTVAIQEATTGAFDGIDFALMAVESDQSKIFSPAAAAAGATVIDNSSAYRMDPACPLVVPEVNPADARRAPKGIIANPNCSTIIMNVPVWPLHKANPIRRIVVSTYQAASGAGRPAMEELEAATRAWAAGKKFQPKVFPYNLAMNLFCHNSPIGPNGYNTEELKMTNETRKIFHAPRIRIAATCVRVPVLRAHCEAISLEFAKPMTEAEALGILRKSPGVKILDDRKKNRSPQPVDATGQYDVYVGRLRQDISVPNNKGLILWVAGDQLLKGAALNAVQIAEILIR